MGETSEAIRDDIDQHRRAMTDDINELEGRARSMTDWRRQYQERPMVVIGVAAALAVLVGLLLMRLVRSDGD